MSSVLVDEMSSHLLEWLMADFRDNWLAHLQDEVKRSIEELGSVKAGRSAVAAKLELGEQTLYQIIENKSGKKYPTAETMALFEKKFGPDRPPGWAALPLGEGQVSEVPARSLSESQWQMLQDFDMLIDEDKHAIRRSLKEKAESMRKIFDEFRKRHNLPEPTKDKRVAESYGTPPPPPSGRVLPAPFHPAKPQAGKKREHK